MLHVHICSKLDDIKHDQEQFALVNLGALSHRLVCVSIVARPHFRSCEISADTYRRQGTAANAVPHLVPNRVLLCHSAVEACGSLKSCASYVARNRRSYFYRFSLCSLSEFVVCSLGAEILIQPNF